MLHNFLLVDDDDTVNFLNKIIIDKSGLANKVLIAKSSVEAIELLKELLLSDNWPDIILVDINMPCTDGWGFIRQMEATFGEINKRYSVAMLSSSLDPGDFAKANASNYIKSLISKPLTFESISQFCQQHHDELK